MSPEEYVMETAAKSLGVAAALLAIMEIYVREGSKTRVLADSLYGYFNSDWVKGFPGRVVRKYKNKVFRLSQSTANARQLMFFFTVDALMLVPITIYRYLPLPMPSRLFNFSPLLYYFLVVTAMIGFLRTMAGALKNKSVPSVFAIYPLLFFCFDIFWMSLFFVSMDKGVILSSDSINSFVFLGLNYLISRPAALVVVTLVIGFSASLLIFTVLSFILVAFNLPDYVISGIANFTSRAMFLVGCAQAFVLAIAPGERIDTRSFFTSYASSLVVIAAASGFFFLLINELERRLFIAMMGLIAIPPLAILGYGQLLRVTAENSRAGDYSFIPVLAFLAAPLLWTYISAFLSGLASASVRVATLFFRSREVALKPFATLSVFLAFLAVLVEFASIQVGFFLRG